MNEQYRAVHVYLAETSICDCGFPLLNERIVAGVETDYYVGPRIAVWGYVCGGCGKATNEICLFFHEKEWPWGRSQAGWMPARAFRALPAVGSAVTNEQLMAALDGLAQECEFSASSGLPFNFPEGKGHWTQLEKTKALIAEFRRRLKERLR